MTTYIVARYCPKCDIYLKCIGHGKYDDWVVNIAYQENERYSASLGVAASQIEEARKVHPGVEWKKFGHSYRPKISNRAEKLKLMKQAKMEEY